MSFLPSFSPPALLTGVPDGYDALLLAELAQTTKKIVYIARDESRALRLKSQLAFFAPSRPVLFFPGWDCLPYDRSSPHPDIIAQRVNTLTSLTERKDSFLIITTLQAFLQKVPPLEAFQGRMMSLKGGQTVGYEALLSFLTHNGYTRRELVQEWGEFAVRGSLIDLFPPGYNFPIRLDFFGKTLETLRTFDPLQQTTIAPVESLFLKPMSEIHLTPESITLFRKKYRDHFGIPDPKDPLYAAISEMRPYVGYEHWLPLFYETLTPFATYVEGSLYCLDDHLEEARTAYNDQIQDHYKTRIDFQSLEKQGIPYHPLPPEHLYITQKNWENLIPPSQKVVFSPFSHPEGTDAGGKLVPSLKSPHHNVFDKLKEVLETAQSQKKRILLVGVTQGSANRLGHILTEHNFPFLKYIHSFPEVLETTTPTLTVFDIDKGFEAPGLLIMTEEDIFGERLGKSVKSKKRSDLFIQEVSSLQVGDLVVHQEHGIGRYEGLKTLTINNASHDCLEVHYDGDTKLYVPVESIDFLSRYGAADTLASLDKLGGVAWQSRKARVKKRLKEVADYLLKIAATRQLHHADVFQRPSGLYDEFAARFPYPETEDQLSAIEDVCQDLTTGRPMDRLICGDVGFGKTEVAMRAAFIAAAAGKQVAVVVPTTLLARQHYQSFITRFKDTGIQVAQLSRLIKPREASLLKERLKKGEIQILIGTHALLSGSVEFFDLGLLIVDEEQHFGVAQKEKLKNLKENIHVLTLTATPIPRTLQMALSGVREMSLIATPPLDRMAVRTFVLPFDAMVMREAILREQFRGGQTFYVCPRISDLEKVAERLRHFVPEVKFAIAHGQMSPRALENVMSEFYDGAYDVLLSTQIIESGIDVSKANTLLIHRADLFGLSQLYQLRGRIGRAKVRGYAYLTYPAGQILSSTAQKRLEVIQSLDTLGAGFTLASHDMDIRGAGNLVGEEQSGHIREVGIELYQHMLEEAILSLKAEGKGETYTPSEYIPQITVEISVLIPDTYVADLGLRLSLYKRLSTLTTRQDIDSFAIELVDRFGPLPPEVSNLLEIVYLKSLARQAGIEKVEIGPKGILITFYKNTFKNPNLLISHIMEQKGTAKLRPDQKIVYIRVFNSPEISLKETAKVLQELIELAAA
jgi:transcription-repair coupling factor (superfamily II helicase)